MNTFTLFYPFILPYRFPYPFSLSFLAYLWEKERDLETSFSPLPISHPPPHSPPLPTSLCPLSFPLRNSPPLPLSRSKARWLRELPSPFSTLSPFPTHLPPLSSAPLPLLFPTPYLPLSHERRQGHSGLSRRGDLSPPKSSLRVRDGRESFEDIWGKWVNKAGMRSKEIEEGRKGTTGE